MPVNIIQLSKISIASAIGSRAGSIAAFQPLQIADPLVGLGGIEPPTSPLSGVRSSHLSYRPTAWLTLVELVGIEPATS